MGEAGLTRERILEAAVDVLRRFGPEKATVVDVARVLGVTHGSVYRYFPSKAALRDAVVQHWLEAMMPPLEAVAAEKGPAPGTAPSLAGAGSSRPSGVERPTTRSSSPPTTPWPRRRGRCPAPTSTHSWGRRPGSSPTAWPMASSPPPTRSRPDGPCSRRRPGSTTRRSRPNGPIPASTRTSTMSGTSSHPAWRHAGRRGEPETGPRPGRIASRGIDFHLRSTRSTVE